MEKDELDLLFENSERNFDTNEPTEGHQQRFLDKLQASQNVITLAKKKNTRWKPLSIAASMLLLLGLGFVLFKSPPSVEQQVAKIAPEVSESEFYFASLIEEQVKILENESAPETKKIIDDTMVQLKKLETNYLALEQELIKGGNSKLILSAMITNFQTRIDLLQNVLQQVEEIKKIKKNNDENFTI